MENTLETQNQPEPQDISREGLSLEKLFHFFRLFNPANNHAIAKVSAFHLIDIARINELLGTNFKGIILDFDECVAPHHGEITQENADALIEMIKSKIKVVIYSNMEKGPRYDALIQRVLEETGYEIKVITSKYSKPDQRGFNEAKTALNLEEDEDVVMIGDNFVTDGGSIHAGIPFIKVDPIKTEEPFHKKAKRVFQTGTRSMHSGISNSYDKLGGRKVIRDNDLLEQATV